MKIKKSLYLGLCIPWWAQAYAQEWEPSPQEVQQAYQSDLNPTELESLSRFLIYPPVAQAGATAFTRGLTLEPITIESVEPDSAGHDVVVDIPRYERAKAALKEIELLRTSPLVDAYAQQAKVVNFFEIRIAMGSQEDRTLLQPELDLAKIQLQSFADQMTTRIQSPMELAILRRAHRALSSDGFLVPPIDVFAREWPSWIFRFLTQDFLKIRLRLKAGLSSKGLSFLSNLKPRLQNFEFVPGKFVFLRPLPPENLSDVDLMQRISVVQEGEAQIATVALTFSGLESFFQKSVTQTILPFSFGGIANAEGGTIEFKSFSTRLCLESSRLENGLFKVIPCSDKSL